MRIYKFLLTASILASVLSTISSWFFYSSWAEVEDTHFVLQKKNDSLNTSYEMLQTAFDSCSNELSLLSDPEYRLIGLSVADVPQKERMRVLWNPYTRKTFVSLLSLPAIEPAEEYKLYCTAGKAFVLVAVFPDNISNDHLMAVGKVAVAESWQLFRTTKGDTNAPAPNQLLLSSH